MVPTARTSPRSDSQTRGLQCESSHPFSVCFSGFVWLCQSPLEIPPALEVVAVSGNDEPRSSSVPRSAKSTSPSAWFSPVWFSDWVRIHSGERVSWLSPSCFGPLGESCSFAGPDCGSGHCADTSDGVCGVQSSVCNFAGAGRQELAAALGLVELS